jgi:hypothetical protein
MPDYVVEYDSESGHDYQLEKAKELLGWGNYA